jgi:putative heme degradation protein
VTVVLNALPRKTWRALVADHPPRDDRDSDKVVGVNEETLSEVLVPKSIDHDASTITGDVDGFLDSLSDYDFDRLYVTAFALNRGSAMADPTQRLASGTSLT